MPWNLGDLLLLRSRFRALRLSVRGFSYSNAPLSEDALSHWNHFKACFPAPGALCKPRESDMLFFSTGVVDIPDSWVQIEGNAYTETVHRLGACENNGGGRVVTVGDTRYEVSLCDILDMNMHFIHDGVNQVMHWKQDTTPVLELLVVALLSVFFVSALSHNLLKIFQRHSVPPPSEEDKDSHKTAWLQLLCVLVTVVYCFVSIFGIHSGLVVLENDQALFIQLCVFILAEILCQILLAIPEAHARQAKIESKNEFIIEQWDLEGRVLMEVLAVPVASDRDGYVSILTACLLLISCRVHYSFDTPYLVFLVVIFGTRSMYKLLRIIDQQTHPTAIELFLQMLDLYVYASLLGNGLTPASYSPLDASMVIQSVALASLVLGYLLWQYKQGSMTAHYCFN